MTIRGISSAQLPFCLAPLPPLLRPQKRRGKHAEGDKILIDIKRHFLLNFHSTWPPPLPVSGRKHGTEGTWEATETFCFTPFRLPENKNKMGGRREALEFRVFFGRMPLNFHGRKEKMEGVWTSTKPCVASWETARIPDILLEALPGGPQTQNGMQAVGGKILRCIK